MEFETKCADSTAALRVALGTVIYLGLFNFLETERWGERGIFMFVRNNAGSGLA